MINLNIRSLLITLLSLTVITLFTACPKPPEDEPPKTADCDPGYLPCEEDSTVCCEVICPPGFVLGGKDSTECIPVQCPEYYHLCGEDSTDCCLEKTSHNFVWEVDTLGNDYGSVLQDVAVVNENNIWVVGKIVVKDSSQSDPVYYNAAHWNGNDWELLQVRDNIYNIEPELASIIYFDSTNIWVGTNNPLHWNGEEWENKGYDAPHVGWINSIWGDVEDNIYFAGSQGKVSYFNGNQFELFDSGGDIPFTDISGNGSHVFVLGWTDQTGESIVYEKKDGEWHELFYLPDFTVDVANGKYGMFSALEVLEDTLYVACSTGMIKYNYIDSTLVFDNSITYPYYWLEITGNHPNDILFVNTGRVTTHYNGIDFLFNSTLMYQLNGIHLWGAILKGDVAVMVGDYAAGYRAIVVRGFRIN